jgi:hypothetical protein
MTERLDPRVRQPLIGIQVMLVRVGWGRTGNPVAASQRYSCGTPQHRRERGGIGVWCRAGTSKPIRDGRLSESEQQHQNCTAAHLENKTPRYLRDSPTHAPEVAPRCGPLCAGVPTLARAADGV